MTTGGEGVSTYRVPSSISRTICAGASVYPIKVSTPGWLSFERTRVSCLSSRAISCDTWHMGFGVRRHATWRQGKKGGEACHVAAREVW